MSDISIYVLNKANAGPFSPYLMPQVRQYLGSGKALIAMGAAIGEHTVGAVAASVENSIVHVVSLYVDPAVRRQGIGTALMYALGEQVNVLDLLVEGAKVYYMEEDEDTEGIAAFLRTVDFGELELSDRLFCVNSADLHHVPGLGEALSSNFQPDPHVRPYAAITRQQLAEIESDESVMDCLKPSAMRFNLMRSVSTIWVEDGHVLGWILAYQGVDDEIVMAAACKRDGAPDGCFRQMLYALANRSYMMLGRDFKTYILTLNDHSGGLVEKITGGALHEYKNYVAETEGELPDWLMPDD